MERERITISIKKRVLKAIDEIIDGIEIRNRSHAIESLAIKGLNLNDSKNAIIMLGGDDALKNIPSAVHFIKKLEEEGYKKVYIAVGFLGEKIKKKIAEYNLTDIEIEYIEGDGTGGALLPLKKQFNNTFIVFNASHTISVNIEKILSYHKRIGVIATIATSDLLKMNGLYVLNSEVFKFIPKGFSMLENDIFPKLLKENNLVVYPTEHN